DGRCKFAINYSGRADTNIFPYPYSIIGVDSGQDLYRNITSLSNCIDTPHNLDCDTKIEKVDPLHGFVVGPSAISNIMAFNGAINTAFSKFSNTTVLDLNTTGQSETAILNNAEPRNVGSLNVNLPASSIYSEVDCPLSDCTGIDSSHVMVVAQTMYARDMANINLQNALKNVPPSLGVLAHYPFYLEATIPCPVGTSGIECPVGVFSALKTSANLQLVVNDPSVINWKDAALYQYIPSSRADGVWAQVSGAVTGTGSSVTFNAMTDPRTPAYLFAVLGIDNTPAPSLDLVSVDTAPIKTSMPQASQIASVANGIEGFFSRMFGTIDF
ncbi:MAG: hypothetical protein AAB965_00100, partial [Patescibacteria group bacterium]